MADRPQPLLTRAAVVSGESVLVAALTWLGLGHASGWVSGHADLIASGVLAVGPMLTALVAHRHVTPVAAPQDTAGNPLVPVSTVDITATPLPVDVSDIVGHDVASAPVVAPAVDTPPVVVEAPADIVASDPAVSPYVAS